MKGIVIAQKCGHLLTWPSDQEGGTQWANMVQLWEPPSMCGSCIGSFTNHHSTCQRQAWKLEAK